MLNKEDNDIDVNPVDNNVNKIGRPNDLNKVYNVVNRLESSH